MSTACVIVIGNEILSGRTQDSNLAWLAKELNELGIRLCEARVVMDSEAAIVEAVNACRTRYDYIFTTGGIGPTHDDITTACIARAFGQAVVRHPDAERKLRAHYADGNLNAARLKMADVPEGAKLIENPVSAAPGFCVENVYVMAGVPTIMRAMFDALKPQLKGGKPMRSRTLSAYTTEGNIAEELTAIQARYGEVEIGSYPFIRQQKLGVSIVLRSTDEAGNEKAAAEVRALLGKFGEVSEG